MQNRNEIDIKNLLKTNRKRNLEMKYLNDNEAKGILNEKNIKELMKKMFLQEHFNLDSLLQNFEDLEKNTGKIMVDDFLEFLSEKYYSKTNFNPFYNIIIEQLTGKSEKIIIKLKKIKQKLNNDYEAIEDIDWIISSICESDIYEPDFTNINKITDDIKTKGLSNLDTQYLFQYSHYWEKERKEFDLLKMTSYSNDKKLLENNIELKKLESISPNLMSSVKENLANIDDFDYNIFDLDDLLDKQTLTYLSLEIFNRLKFFEKGLVKEDKFRNFVKEITNGYDRNVTYHNDLHAADVLQTTHVIIHRGDLTTKLQLQKIDIFSCLVSAIIHDYKHPGLNNIYHINAKSKYAIRYNDISVLENYHVSQSFKVILNNSACNILDSLTPEEYRLARRRIIECIISTDMANHTKTLAALKSKVETFDIKSGRNIERMIFPENLPKTFENQQTILNMVIHTADISNPAKPEHIQKTWVDLIFIEFFKQGDLEIKQNLPVSLLCDRKTTNIDKSQIGFINFIIIPTFESLLNIVPEIYPFMEYLKSNLKKYEQLANQK